MFDWLLEVSPVLIVGIILGKCGDWLWQKFYVAKRNLESESAHQEIEFQQLLYKVIDEIDSNCMRGVGDEKCPFRLTEHTSLALSLNQKLPKETKASIKLILDEARLCNAGRLQNGVTPNRVKEMGKLLKNQLRELLPAEKSICK